MMCNLQCKTLEANSPSLQQTIWFINALPQITAELVEDKARTLAGSARLCLTAELTYAMLKRLGKLIAWSEIVLDNTRLKGWTQAQAPAKPGIHTEGDLRPKHCR